MHHQYTDIFVIIVFEVIHKPERNKKTFFFISSTETREYNNYCITWVRLRVTDLFGCSRQAASGQQSTVNFTVFTDTVTTHGLSR